MKRIGLLALAMIFVASALLANETNEYSKIHCHNYKNSDGIPLPFPMMTPEMTTPESLIVDFGSLGLLKYENGIWAQLSPWDAKNIWISNTDIIVNFGPAHGIWKYSSDMWSLICSESPKNILGMSFTALVPNGRGGYWPDDSGYADEITAYFESLGLCKITASGVTCISPYYPESSYSYNGDTYFDFGSHGLWKYSDNVLTQICGWDPNLIYPLYDLSGGSFFLVDFDSHGLWCYKDNALSLVSSADPINIFWGGSGELYLDFGETDGLCRYRDGILTLISSTGGARNIISINDDVIIDFGAVRGIWKYSNGDLAKIFDIGGAKSWSSQSTYNAPYVVTLYFDEPNGIWKYENNIWTQIAPYSIEDWNYGFFSQGGEYFDFGEHGLWKYSNNVLTQISEWNPKLIYRPYGLDSDPSLLIDFDSHGLWKYSNNILTQISEWDSIDMFPIGSKDGTTLSVSIDFYPHGLWLYENDALTLISPFSPVYPRSIYGPYNSCIDFGKNGGLCTYENGVLTQIHPESPIEKNDMAAIIVNFGPQYGIWVYEDFAWSQLHNISPKSITGAKSYNYPGPVTASNYGLIGYYSQFAGPIDELIIDFGPGYGIWEYLDNVYWWQVHPLSADSICAGDIDGDRQNEVIIDFGPDYGIWIRNNLQIWFPDVSQAWSQLHNISPESILVTNLDADLRDDLIIDFGPDHGIWIYHNNSTWTQLHTVSAESITSGDMDNNEQQDLIVDFGSQYGIWIYYNNSVWQQLHTINAEQIITADLDQDAKDDIVIDFGSQYGIWVYYNNSTWTQLHSVSPDSIATGDLNGNGVDELIVDFGPAYGIWVYNDDGAWWQLHTVSP